MTGEPEAVACETQGGIPAVIHLPDQSQPLPKKMAKRQRSHIRQTRYSDTELAEFNRRARTVGLTDGAYTRLATIGGTGPRARRRAPVDEVALMQAVAAFNRAHNNLNQITRTLNTLAIFAEEHGAARMLVLLDELRQPIDHLKSQFAAPVAAILGAVGDVREG